MPTYNPQLQAAVNFIKSHANKQELEILRAALDRRLGVSMPEGIDSIDFGDIARKMAADMAGRFSVPGADTINQMTRRIVMGMIKEKEPGISDEHLEVLLERWVPTPGKTSEGKENELPLEALMSMVDQFISYSVGRMPLAEQEALSKHMPEWPKRYWDTFSPETRQLIAEFLHGKCDSKTFWSSFQQYLNRQRRSQ